jgi:hypothetical protein
MRKIVGFKINLRAWEIQRRAKKAEIPFSEKTQDEIQALLDQTASSLKPATLFETFSCDDSAQKAFFPFTGIAYSLVLSTLGEPGNWAIDPALAKQEALILEFALEECRKFAVGILESEAKLEACELSPLISLTNPEAIEAAVQKLDGKKIGVSFLEGRLSPHASGASILNWVSKIKRKKSAKTGPVREPGSESAV